VLAVAWRIAGTRVNVLVGLLQRLRSAPPGLVGSSGAQGNDDSPAAKRGSISRPLQSKPDPGLSARSKPEQGASVDGGRPSAQLRPTGTRFRRSALTEAPSSPLRGLGLLRGLIAADVMQGPGFAGGGGHPGSIGPEPAPESAPPTSSATIRSQPARGARRLLHAVNATVDGSGGSADRGRRGHVEQPPAGASLRVIRPWRSSFELGPKLRSKAPGRRAARGCVVIVSS